MLKATILESAPMSEVINVCRIVEGLEEAMALPEDATAELQIWSDRNSPFIVGYKIAGSEKLRWEREHVSLRNRSEMGAGLLTMIARIHAETEARTTKKFITDEMSAPPIFKRLLDEAGITMAEFIKLIKNKTTSWNDGIPGAAGRKVPKLPLPLRTAGEFHGDCIRLHAIADSSGTRVDFLNDYIGATFVFKGPLPESTQQALEGQPLSAFAEMAELKNYDNHHIIKRFEFRNFGGNLAQFEHVENVNLGQETEEMKNLLAAVRQRLEKWAGGPLVAPHEETEEERKARLQSWNDKQDTRAAA